MELSVQKHGEVTEVLLRGDHLDAGGAEAFKRDATPILDSNPRVVFNMTQVQFLDSAGLGALLFCLRRLTSAGGDLKLFGLNRQVRGVIQMTRMHKLFDIFETREEAFEALQTESGGDEARDGAAQAPQPGGNES